MATQVGYLEAGPDAGDGGPFTIKGIFGKAAPSPLVINGATGASHLEMGGHEFGVAPMSGVQTVDQAPGPLAPEGHIPHARNLLRPMHGESFWILMLALAAFGLFSVAGHLRLGPIQFGGQVGKK
jgi:hypothetical protein